ncbi:MAG: 2-oxoglutarate-dependent dioxygenase [Leptothrix sp. (in: Bacteria)]|nr:2-oxoglutarate-dependent dioxygenase [Leptothrix sp. (in: b-proteobacteria)]
MSTATQIVTDDLRRWIVAQAEAGCRPDDVLAAMKTSGWDEDVALEAMEETLRQRLDELGPRPVVPLLPAVPVPEPAAGGACELLLSDGHRVRLLTTMGLPRVVVFGGLLSDAECEALMALAAPRLVRSETVDNDTGGSEVNAARTSDGMFFERGEAPLIQAIEARIAELLHWPLDHGEGLQVLRYRPGAEYKPHHDYFDPAHAGTASILKRGGQRVGTLVMYLNTPEGGGATTFPDVGLEVAPVRGNAVFFSYDRAHASTKTLHGGAPVTAGEKWVATKWLREGVFA